MFRFENIEFLYALGLVPVLIIVFLLSVAWRKRKLELLGNSDLIEKMTIGYSKYKEVIKFSILVLAIGLLAVSLSNPQWGNKKEKVKAKASDVFIALDISRSMLAEDVRPSRMERAKKFAQNLVNHLKGERIGIILFAGNAYLQMPLTTDYSAAMLFLKSANPKLAPSQGTAISEAIDLAEKSFDEDNKHHKALVIITDGENHDQETITRAEEANENGLLIFGVGVGTEEGGLIPINTARRKDYKRDNTGTPIKSKLNIKMLADLADAGDGAYFNLTDDTEAVVEAVRGRIDKIAKRELEARSFTNYASYFQYFLLPAILLLLIEFFISYRKKLSYK